jgi:hypothetical protein
LNSVFPDTLVDLKIELWRKSDSIQSVHQYLGWTKRDYEIWKDTGKTPWIESIYSISAVSTIDSVSMERAVEAIFNRITKLRENKKIDIINSLFFSINVDRLEEHLLVAFLMSCLDARDDFYSWQDLFERTRTVSIARAKAEKELNKVWK